MRVHLRVQIQTIKTKPFKFKAYIELFESPLPQDCFKKSKKPVNFVFTGFFYKKQKIASELNNAQNKPAFQKLADNGNFYPRTYKSTMSNTPANKTNAHIASYLKYYRAQPNPQYAVLLKGGWGSGKTWFIKKLLDEYESGDAAKNSPLSKKRELQRNIYISLFGIKTIEEIETKLIALMTSKWQKGLKFLGSLATGAIKTTVKVDLNEALESANGLFNLCNKDKLKSSLDAFDEMALSLDVDLSQEKNAASEPKFKPLLIVFDDLERAQMDVGVILGYINNLTEHSKIHAVIVADEEKLLKSNETPQTSRDYAATKEKLIGATFEVAHDTNDMFDDLIKQARDENIQALLETHRATLIAIHEASGYKNLRLLKQLTCDFEHIYQQLPNNTKHNTQFLKVFLGQYAVLSLEHRKNPCELKAVLQLLSTNWDKIFKDEAQENTGTQDDGALDAKKYQNIVDLKDSQISPELWSELLESGACDAADFSKALAEHSRFFREKPEPWFELRSYRYLERKKFDSALEATRKIFSDGSQPFTLVDDMLQTYNLLLLFAPEQKSDLIEQAKKHISAFSNNAILNFANDLSNIYTHMAAYEKSVKDLLPHLKQRQIEALPSMSTKFSTDLIACLGKNDLASLEKMLVHNHIFQDNAWQALEQTPILATANVNAFLDALIKSCASMADKRQVFAYLGTRRKMQDEAKWFSDLRTACKRGQENNVFPVLEQLFIKDYIYLLGDKG
jgi:hypothetical protein